MTIVKQMSLFGIQEILEMESSRRFDEIFATFDVQPVFQLFSKKTLRGAPRELNYNHSLFVLSSGFQRLRI
ncbi:hypothetical protein C3943_26875 [Lysinibacillus sp. B2A1]|nr:hypothetical protein C3943_26875 [Lysinibacillus sp. B2A1]